MKKIGILSVVIIGMVSFTQAFNFSGCQERVLTFTAYYSPETGQAFYYQPTFQQEETLNGEGDFGASGKRVFKGMLAGPSTYPFGTIVYLPGFGVGEIADRGGAIVVSGERGESHDRIDIRMGNAEDGLIRALTFGKKTMTGYVCEAGSMKIATKDMMSRSSVPVFKHFFDISIRIQQLEQGRHDIRTRTLQKYLVKLGFLDKKYRNGTFENHTKQALCRYQVKRRIVGSTTPDCGVFGKMTRETMKSEVKQKSLLPVDLYATGSVTDIIELAKYYNGKPKNTAIQQGNIPTVQQSAQPYIFKFYRAYSKGEQNSEIKMLQRFLQSQKLYTGSIDGIYSRNTMDAVYAFQKKYGLISDVDPLSVRGYLGPKTRAKINELRLKDA